LAILHAKWLQCSAYFPAYTLTGTKSGKTGKYLSAEIPDSGFAFTAILDDEGAYAFSQCLSQTLSTKISRRH
jgi:hypothetical protein